MFTYVVLLHGVNVGGKNVVDMKQLQCYLSELHFKNISTYIQSGNIIFQSEKIDTSCCEQQIEALIRTRFNVRTTAIVMTKEKLRDLVTYNPFHMRDSIHSKNLHVTYLKSNIDPQSSSRLLKRLQAGEEVTTVKEAVYLYCSNGYGGTKLKTRYVEKTLATAATTRNWKTTLELLKMANKNN